MNRGAPPQDLMGALEALHAALLGRDPAAIESAAALTGTALRALERQAPPPSVLAQLAAMNDKAGALVAARQASVNWALSRISPQSDKTYGSDGQNEAGRAPRHLGSA